MLLTVGIAAVLLPIVAVVLYRWKFHPLSCFPGPFLAKLTDLYIVYHLIQGNLHIEQRRLHAKYGPVVRAGPNKLIFNSPTGLQEIYSSRNVRKAAGYAATDPVPGFPNVFTSIDTNVHRLKRKAISPAFSDQFIRKFESRILKGVDEFIEALVPPSHYSGADTWSEPHNMSDRCKYFTLDVMGYFGFGESLNVQTNPTNRGIILGMRAGAYVSGTYSQMPELRRFNLHKYVKVSGAWTQARYGELCRELIKQRVSLARDARPDLLGFAIETKDEETGGVFKLDDLWAESRMFLLAGSETSATVLSSVFFYLSRYPQCHAKLVAELQDAFQTSEEIRLGNTLSDCQYLRGVIDESMRLSPPVGNAIWREVCSHTEVFDGHAVPRGSEIGVSLYSLFHTESIYPESDTFIPERFLKNGRFPHVLQQARAAFKPFSLGSRNCVGMNLAYAEMTLLIAKAVWVLDFKLPEGPERHLGEGSPDSVQGRQNVNEFQIKTFITSLHDGPMLCFRSRGAI